MRGCAGKTMAENLNGVPSLKAGQTVIQTVEAPIKSSGHLQVPPPAAQRLLACSGRAPWHGLPTDTCRRSSARSRGLPEPSALSKSRRTREGSHNLETLRLSPETETRNNYASRGGVHDLRRETSSQFS